jgi:hypothetical protein
MGNFKFFALQYLNDWFGYDRRFVDGLSPTNSRGVRLRCIQEAAKYYRINRNFKTLPDEERLSRALAAVDEVSVPITEDSVDSAVCDLAKAFQKSYGSFAVSAASKFLWLRHQAPVVIYDSRAIQYLDKACDGKLGQCDYADYRKEWHRQFAKQEHLLRSACFDLIRVKEFSRARDIADDALRGLATSRWFIERVFDTFLWWNADDFAAAPVQ